VPIHLVGEAQDVERGDGLVEQSLHTLEVHAKPADIPNAIEVDISGLAIGDAIRVGDLRLPSGVTTDTDPEETVVAGASTRAAVEAEADDAAGEADAGEAGGADEA